MLNTISLDTDLLLYLTLIIAFGWMDLLNSKNPFFIIMICRTNFTPPAVDPAEAPKNIKKKNTIVKKGVQMVKSADTKPVVVITETT